MFDVRRLLERLLFFVLASVCTPKPPATTTVSDGLFGGHCRKRQKNAAMSFVQAALSMADDVTRKQISDPSKFREGLGKVIQGTVECLNASLWAKPANN
jgi:hypothetical protein